MKKPQAASQQGQRLCAHTETCRIIDDWKVVERIQGEEKTHMRAAKLMCLLAELDRVSPKHGQIEVDKNHSKRAFEAGQAWSSAVVFWKVSQK